MLYGAVVTAAVVGAAVVGVTSGVLYGAAVVTAVVGTTVCVRSNSWSSRKALAVTSHSKQVK